MGNTTANSIPVAVPAASDRNLTYLALYAMIAIYSVSRVLQAFPQRAPLMLTVVLHVVPALLFALLHGRLPLGMEVEFLCFSRFAPAYQEQLKKSALRRASRLAIISSPTLWGQSCLAFRSFSDWRISVWATCPGFSQA